MLWSRGMLWLHMLLPSLGTSLQVLFSHLVHLVIAMGSLFFPSGEFFWVLCRDWGSWEPYLAPDVLNGGYSGGHCPSLKN